MLAPDTSSHAPLRACFLSCPTVRFVFQSNLSVVIVCNTQNKRGKKQSARDLRFSAELKSRHLFKIPHFIFLIDQKLFFDSIP